MIRIMLVDTRLASVFHFNNKRDEFAGMGFYLDPLDGCVSI